MAIYIFNKTNFNLIQLMDEVYVALNKKLYAKNLGDIVDGYCDSSDTQIIFNFYDNLTPLEEIGLNNIIANYVLDINYDFILTGQTINTYFLKSSDSDISGYKQAVLLPFLVNDTGGTITSLLTTASTLMASFVTNINYPRLTYIPVGLINVHYEVKKLWGTDNYYTYYEIYKRTTGGTEILLTTSDNSSVENINTTIQVTLTSLLTSDIFLDVTDRIVVKLYGVMMSSTASVDLFYGGNTNARIELTSPLFDNSKYVPYIGAIADINLGNKNIITNELTANTIISGSTDLSIIIDNIMSGITSNSASSFAKTFLLMGS